MERRKRRGKEEKTKEGCSPAIHMSPFKVVQEMNEKKEVKKI